MTLPELDAIKAHLAETATTEAALEEWLLQGEVVGLGVVAEALDNARIAGYMAEELVAAVEAVLELHQPYITRSAWQTCNECWNSGTAEIVYPCPTVATIERALKEEQ